MPRILTAYREERFDREILNEDGGRSVGPTIPEELAARARLRGLWADLARDRAGRFRLSLAMSVQS